MIEPGKKTYDGEKREFKDVPPGSYIVVNTNLQWQRTSNKVDDGCFTKLRFSSRILECLQTTDGSEPESWVNQTIFWDIIWDDRNGWHKEKIAELASAAGIKKPFDEQNDTHLTAALTGRPYILKRFINKKGYSACGYFRAVSDGKAAELKSGPSWKMPDSGSIWLEPKDWHDKGPWDKAGSYSTPTMTADVSIEEDDLPF